MSDPTTYKQAPEEAKRIMNEALRDHGIRVATPTPQFDERYEDAIEQRKEADQEVEELKARFLQLTEKKDSGSRRFAGEDVEMQELQGELIRSLRSAEQDAIRVRKTPTPTPRSGAPRAVRGGDQRRAAGLTAKYTKEAEGIESRARALEERGEVVVREALVQKLLGVRFTLVPTAVQRPSGSSTAGSSPRTRPCPPSPEVNPDERPAKIFVTVVGLALVGLVVLSTLYPGPPLVVRGQGEPRRRRVRERRAHGFRVSHPRRAQVAHDRPADALQTFSTVNRRNGIERRARRWRSGPRTATSPATT